MLLDDYQNKAVETAIFPRTDNLDIIYPALKLAGEAGEVAEKVGKAIRDDVSKFTEKEYLDSLAKELGDVLWYVAALADSIGYDLSEIAQINLDKLSSRQARGVIGGSGDDR